jgi:hypothetical protein
MNLKEVKTIENCFDGDGVYDFIFDLPWTKRSIEKLQILGKLDYYPDFPRPFFRIRDYKGAQLKGLEGECSCRVILPYTDRNIIKQQLEKFLESL